MISLPVDLARAPPLNNIFLFNKATLIFFLHQRKIEPELEDRTVQLLQLVTISRRMEMLFLQNYISRMGSVLKERE